MADKVVNIENKSEEQVTADIKSSQGTLEGDSKASQPLTGSPKAGVPVTESKLDPSYEGLKGSIGIVDIIKGIDPMDPNRESYELHSVGLKTKEELQKRLSELPKDIPGFQCRLILKVVKVGGPQPDIENLEGTPIPVDHPKSEAPNPE